MNHKKVITMATISAAFLWMTACGDEKTKTALVIAPMPELMLSNSVLKPILSKKQLAEPENIKALKGLVLNEDIAVWGDYKEGLFSQVKLDDNKTLLLLSDSAIGAGYAGFGLRIPSNVEAVDNSDEYALLNQAQISFVSKLKDGITKAYPKSSINNLGSSRARNQYSPVYTTSFLVTTPKAANASVDHIKNVLIYGINNNIKPNDMPVINGVVGRKVKVDVALWRDNGQVYGWVGSYLASEEYKVLKKYRGLSKGSSLMSHRILMAEKI